MRRAQQQKRIAEQRRYHEMMANTVCWGGGTWALLEGGAARRIREVRVGLYPIATLQYNSTTLYQVSCHIR